MSTLLWPVLAVIAAVLQVCTGVLRDASGVPSFDLVLILSVAAAVWRGPLIGLVCGLMGGIVLGAPGGTSIETAVIYGLCGGLAGIASHQRLVSAVVLVVCIGAITSLVLAIPTHLDGSRILSDLVPLVGRTMVATALIVLAARRTGHVVEN